MFKLSATRPKLTAWSPRTTGLTTRARLQVVSAVRINFSINYKCNIGDNLVIVGSGESMGNWDPNSAMKMDWSPGDVWVANITTDNPEVEYKYAVRLRSGDLLWIDGENLHIKVSNSEQVCRLLGLASVDEVNIEDLWDRSAQFISIKGPSCRPVQGDYSLPDDAYSSGSSYSTRVEVSNGNSYANDNSWGNNNNASSNGSGNDHSGASPAPRPAFFKKFGSSR